MIKSVNFPGQLYIQNRNSLAPLDDLLEDGRVNVWNWQRVHLCILAQVGHHLGDDF